MKKCPYCAELIQEEAVVCRFCGRNLTDAQGPQAVPLAPPARLPGRRKWLTCIAWGCMVLLLIACAVTGGFGGTRLLTMVQIQVSEQAYHAQLTKVSDLMYAQATRTQRAASVHRTATAAARTQYISDPFDAILTLEMNSRTGSLAHQNGAIGLWCGTVWLRDFVAEATFVNPYDPSTNKWDYGFLFRHTEGDRQYRLQLTSDKEWALSLWDKTYQGKKAGGYVSDMQTGKGESNTIRIVVRRDKGYLYVNDIFISDMDLSLRMQSGEVCIATGIMQGYVIAGDHTKYQDFRIWSIDGSN